MRTKALILVCLMLIIPVAARAADSDSAATRTIVVDGSGEAQATPDTASLNLAIQTTGRTAAQASGANADLASKVVAALKSKLGDKGTVSTGGYSLNPEYDQRPGREHPSIVGYTAQNSITVETGQLDLVGELIDAAIGAGANSVNYLNFSLKNDADARAKAITMATHDAREQAQALADALGVKLGKIVKATTVSEPQPIRMERPMMAMAKMSAPTPVEPGQVSVSASVTLTYEIE
ncbi:MAG TPA: SIMPL domain-containing protein [Candidatus Binataceae bacterium]|nr:SIMPL domain-containing protein [Candidatus Binataceae bacterium]